MPYHLMLDHAGEAKLGKLEIGTTRRGIGPCYADKAARLGIRMQDLLDEKILKKKIVAALEPKRLSLRPFAKDPALDLQAMTDQYLTYGHVLEPLHRGHLAGSCCERLDDDEMVVFEGAQGALLDIDHGTYPFVTSSNPVAGAACIGAGVGPKDIDEVWGVAKAYVTRVGAGPFPTELDGPLADEIRERGGEYGTTTGRARRVGWLDLVALRYAARLNSLTALAITKLDVLSGLDPIRVCTRYRSDEGAELDHFPYHQTVLHHAAGEYEELPGWSDDLTECTSESELPAAARDYLRFVAEFVGVPIALIGVGPGREQVIWTRRARGWGLGRRAGSGVTRSGLCLSSGPVYPAPAVSCACGDPAEPITHCKPSCLSNCQPQSRSIVSGCGSANTHPLSLRRYRADRPAGRGPRVDRSLGRLARRVTLSRPRREHQHEPGVSRSRLTERRSAGAKCDRKPGPPVHGLVRPARPRPRRRRRAGRRAREPDAPVAPRRPAG